MNRGEFPLAFVLRAAVVGSALTILAPAANAQLAGRPSVAVNAETERTTTGRLGVDVPSGWSEWRVEGDVFGLRYSDGETDDAPTLSLAGDFGPHGTARVGLSTLIGEVQTSTPGFRVEGTTDIEVPGATSAVRLDFAYGTEEENGVFQGIWIVAADDRTDQSIALALSARAIDEEVASEVQSSLAMLSPDGSDTGGVGSYEVNSGETDSGGTGSEEADSGEAAPAGADAAAAQGTQGSQALATGRYENGEIIAEVDGLVVDGERLTVKMALRPTEPGERVGSTVLYSSLGGATYEEVYLISGDKKYMLVRDSNGEPLAPPSLSASGKGAMVGTWYGVFPKPPAGQDITLYMPGMEPIGPFRMTAD